MPAKPIDWTVPGILGGLAAILFLMAAVGIVADRIIYARVATVEGWPTTDAMVVRNEMKIVDGLDSRTGKWGKVERLFLEYTYEVDGRPYTGKQLNIARTSGKFVHTDYPVGSQMPVRYDPADPSIAGARMDLRSQMGVHWFFYASAGLTALGLVLAFFATRSLLRQRAATT